MRIPFFLIALCLFGTSARAHDDDNPYYLQLGVGALFSDKAEVLGQTTDFDPGVAASLALGRHCSFSERFGINFELETYYQYFTVDESDLLLIPSAVEDDAKALAFLLNGLLEWRFTPQFAVYGGGGVGFASSIKYEAWDSGSLKLEDDNGLCAQGRLGFDYNLGGNYDVLLGYRYFRTEALEIRNQLSQTSDDLEIGQHVLEIGFRWGL